MRSSVKTDDVTTSPAAVICDDYVVYNKRCGLSTGPESMSGMPYTMTTMRGGRD